MTDLGNAIDGAQVFWPSGEVTSLPGAREAAARPGLSAPERARPKPVPAVAPSAAVRPDAAVRARLNAAIIDNIFVGVLAQPLLWLMGADMFSVRATLFVLAVQFLYCFAYELRTGQTIGKRAMHVRVVALDGSHPTPRMCATRNALRPLDALPVLYASGLLSLLRTGRSRRQRIGDVVAGTTIVLSDGGKPLVTQRWLLPVATVLATVASLGILATPYEYAAARRGPDLRDYAAAGFPGDNSQRPKGRNWIAVGTVTASRGYGSNEPGSQFVRHWRIDKTCDGGACKLWLTRELQGGPPTTAELVQAADGWHATFPARDYPCGEADGQTITWPQHTTWVVRFTGKGRTAEAHERHVSYSPRCGMGTSTTDWIARRVKR